MTDTSGCGRSVIVENEVTQDNAIHEHTSWHTDSPISDKSDKTSLMSQLSLMTFHIDVKMHRRLRVI